MSEHENYNHENIRLRMACIPIAIEISIKATR